MHTSVLQAAYIPFQSALVNVDDLAHALYEMIAIEVVQTRPEVQAYMGCRCVSGQCHCFEV